MLISSHSGSELLEPPRKCAATATRATATRRSRLGVRVRAHVEGGAASRASHANVAISLEVRRATVPTRHRVKREWRRSRRCITGLMCASRECARACAHAVRTQRGSLAHSSDSHLPPVGVSGPAAAATAASPLLFAEVKVAWRWLHPQTQGGGATVAQRAQA